MTLAVRSMQAEQMDADDLPQPVYAAVLADLARVNRWTMTARPILNYLSRVVPPGQPFSLLDVGFGHGDGLRAVERWARRRGSVARLVGVDLNPGSAPVARSAAPAGSQIEYRTGDAGDLAERFDFWTASQVAHHMTDDALVAFIQLMEARARRGWVVGDLHRHWLAHRSYPLLARVLRVHPIVRADGTLSVARGFLPHEMGALIARAGLDSAATTIRWFMPFRLCVARTR
ncbi:methyltransferase domain-containing protein [Sphingomonas sp. CJ99]